MAGEFSKDLILNKNRLGAERSGNLTQRRPYWRRLRPRKCRWLASVLKKEDSMEKNKARNFGVAIALSVFLFGSPYVVSADMATPPPSYGSGDGTSGTTTVPFPCPGGNDCGFSEGSACTDVINRPGKCVTTYAKQADGTFRPSGCGCNTSAAGELEQSTVSPTP